MSASCPLSRSKPPSLAPPRFRKPPRSGTSPLTHLPATAAEPGNEETHTRVEASHTKPNLTHTRVEVSHTAHGNPWFSPTRFRTPRFLWKTFTHGNPRFGTPRVEG